MAGWLAGCWLAGLLACCLAAGWLAGWLLAGWLAGWPAVIWADAHRKTVELLWELKDFLRKRSNHFGNLSRATLNCDAMAWDFGKC